MDVDGPPPFVLLANPPLLVYLYRYALDLIFLLIETFDFVEVGIVQAPIFLVHYDHLCRFRSFLKGFPQCQSSWILAMLVNLMMGCSLHSHLLIPSLFGCLTPGNATEACGPVNLISPYAASHFQRWPIVQVSNYTEAKSENDAWSVLDGAGRTASGDAHVEQ